MLRSLIEFKGETQARVAARTGIPESTLSEILAGKRKLAIKHVSALAKYSSGSWAVAPRLNNSHVRRLSGRASRRLPRRMASLFDRRLLGSTRVSDSAVALDPRSAVVDPA